MRLCFDISRPKKRQRINVISKSLWKNYFIGMFLNKFSTIYYATFSYFYPTKAHCSCSYISVSLMLYILESELSSVLQIRHVKLKVRIHPPTKEIAIRKCINFRGRIIVFIETVHMIDYILDRRLHCHLYSH